MSRHVDELGFPGTWQDSGQFDGGDTAAIVGTLMALHPMPIDFAWAYSELLSGDKPVRHPKFTEDAFSRDQLIPMLAAGVMLYKNPQTDRLFAMHRRRFFLTAWNGDLTGPEVWALWLRYCRPWWSRLFLWALDLEHLFGAILWRFFRVDNVTRNHMLVSIVSRTHIPTLISQVSSLIDDDKDLVRRWRAHCLAVDEYPTWELFERALK